MIGIAAGAATFFGGDKIKINGKSFPEIFSPFKAKQGDSVGAKLVKHVGNLGVQVGAETRIWRI